MPIDLERAHELMPELRFTVLERFSRKGHEVAVMRIENVVVEHDCHSIDLQCECDFDLEVQEKDGRVSLLQKSDSHKCPAKRAVRRYLLRRSRRRYGVLWRDMGVKEAILDIHQRVKDDEHLGNWLGGVVYAQEVAELLELSPGEVLSACDELFKEERLQLNGMILWDFVPRFRFPRQMRAIMAYIIEEPLGWPNGEAGDGYVCGVEEEYEERTGLGRGIDAFGEANWPDIGMDILSMYALEPVVTELRWIAQEADPVAKLKSIRREQIPVWLDGLSANHAEIRRDAFAEFIFRLFELTLDRIEIDKAMRTKKVPPGTTVGEIADLLESYYRSSGDR